MKNMNHHFAAVLAADVAQYSRFMEGDSEATVAALKSCRATFRRCISAHGGREFGTFGDSLMAAFPSAAEALRAARECQRHFAKLAPLNDRGERLTLRIGLHAGDVIDDGENLFGDIVNTAARLQAIAIPGGIVLSGFVYQQVHKEPGFTFRSLGRQPLKNISEPVKAFEVVDSPGRFSPRRWVILLRRQLVAAGAICGAIVASFAYYVAEIDVHDTITVEPLNPRAIAVLPFESRNTNGSDDRSLALGLHDNLLKNLASVENLRVISRPTIERYARNNSTLLEIAAKVDAANILSASVLRSENRVRVSIQLTLLPGNKIAWDETYDRDLTVENLFDVLREVTREIADTLQMSIRAGASGRLQSHPTENLEAYEEYLRGVASKQRFHDPVALRRAEQQFQRAIELDHDFALARVQLADTMMARWYYDPQVNDATLTERRSLIETALEIDPNIASAYVSLGALQTDQGEYLAAEKSFRKALELEPGNYSIHQWFGLLYYFQRRYEEALIHYERAIILAPDNPNLRINKSGALAGLGRYQDSLEVLMDGVRQYPEFPSFYWRIAEWHEHDGAIGEALRWAEVAESWAPDNARTKIRICHLHLILRNHDAAEQCLDGVRDRFEDTLVKEHLQIAFARSEFDKVQTLLAEYLPIPIVRPQSDRKRSLPKDIVRGRRHGPIAAVEVVRYWLAIADIAQARAALRSIEPNLFDEDGDLRSDLTFDLEPPIVVEDLNTEDQVTLMYDVAAILYLSGDVERADPLFDRLLEILRAARKIERHHDDPGEWVGTINEVAIHAVRKDSKMVLETVRNSLDEPTFGWFAEEGALFDFIRDDPEWIELMHTISERAARQRRYYDERKGQPLF